MNRILITVLLAALFSLAAQAQTQQATETVSFKFKARSNKFLLRGNEAELKRLYLFVEQYKPQIQNGEMPLYVNGYCASFVHWRDNLKVARIRVNRVKSELITVKGLKEEHFQTSVYSESYEGEKDIVLVSVHFPPAALEKAGEKTPQKPVEKQPDPEITPPQPVEDLQAQTDVADIQSPVSEDFGKFFLRTNLLYWAVATPNLGMEWRLSKSTGILLNGTFSHWVWSGEDKQHRTWLVQPEIRRYFGESRQWFAGIEGHAGGFNFKFGDTGYQGDAFGGGITGGYHLQLNKHFGMDFSLGAGYTRLIYDTYYRSKDVMVRRNSGVKKHVFAPTQAGVSIIWNLDSQNSQDK
jgi:hypothetical protein